MCGICGYISKRGISFDALKRMNDTMIHRGPDDSGVVQQEMPDGYLLGMAHRRLSIMDLSSLGHQPMYSADKKICIVFNGEIYNFKELRVFLQKEGYKFVSECDTEVVIAAYCRWGTDFLSHFNGMFALALWDSRKNILLLARDRMGKKPLYYYIQDSETFVWASELKPIMEYPYFKKIIRKEIISSYLCRNYIKAPDTIFEDTYKLEPGQYIIWNKGTISKYQYWSVTERYKDLSKQICGSYGSMRKELQDLIFDSVDRRMIADVPVGVFLSGGIDSALVASVARRLKKEPIKTFTIGFETEKENEAQHALQLAQYLGTEHKELYLKENDLLDMLDELPRYYDEPFADSSQIPTMLVSKLASADVSVVLSGDGGDELFCGYGAYDNLKKAQNFDLLGGGMSLLKISSQSAIWDKIPYGMKAVIENRDKNCKTQLFVSQAEKYAKAMLKGNSRSAIFLEDITIKNWQIRRMLLDMRSYLPDEILTKVDRATMKYSVEARCPLLDYRIVEYSFQIPHKYKYYRKDKKHILKEILFDMAPKEILERPKKGFGVPLNRWFRTTLKSKLDIYSDAKILEKQGIFEYSVIRDYIDLINRKNNETINYILWAFLVFQMWYQTYIEDLWIV